MFEGRVRVGEVAFIDEFVYVRCLCGVESFLLPFILHPRSQGSGPSCLMPHLSWNLLLYWFLLFLLMVAMIRSST